MKPTSQPIPLPLPAMLASMMGVTLALGAVCVALAPGSAGRAAAVLGAAIVLVAAVVGLWPLVVGARLGLSGAMFGYFIGAALRFVGCLAVGFLAARYKGYAPAPLFVTVVAVYLPVLFVEVALLARAVWRSLPPPPQREGWREGASPSTPDAPATRPHNVGTLSRREDAAPSPRGGGVIDAALVSPRRALA